MNEDWRNKAHELIKTIAEQTTAAFGGSADIEIRKGYPVLFNDPENTDEASKLAQEYLGVEKVKALEIRMTAEDFAFYSHKVPVCFFRLGVGDPEKAMNYGVHHPKFDIHADALRVGVEAMLSVVFNG